ASTLTLSWQRPPGAEAFAPNAIGADDGLFFLRRSGAVFTPLAVSEPASSSSDLYLRVSSSGLPASYTYAASTALSDKLAAELAATMETGGAPISLRQAIDGLETLNAASSAGVYRRFTTQSSPELRTIGFAGLVRSGDAAALQEVQR